MKIAVYLLDAVVTGTTAFAFHLATGLRLANHDVTTLTSTTSGKQTVRWGRVDGGARWWHTAPDVTVQHDALAETLDDFDLVIVNDVANCSVIFVAFPSGGRTRFTIGRATRCPDTGAPARLDGSLRARIFTWSG